MKYNLRVIITCKKDISKVLSEFPPPEGWEMSSAKTTYDLSYAFEALDDPAARMHVKKDLEKMYSLCVEMSSWKCLKEEWTIREILAREGSQENILRR